MKKFVLILFSLFTFSFLGANEYKNLQNDISKLRQENKELRQENKALKQKTIDANKRIDDLYKNLNIWVYSILGVIVLILGANYATTVGVARRRAKKELSELNEIVTELIEKAKELDIEISENNSIQKSLKRLKIK